MGIMQTLFENRTKLPILVSSCVCSLKFAPPDCFCILGSRVNLLIQLLFSEYEKFMLFGTTKHKT